MIQLIATDMDGTLLDEEKQLPAQLPALLEELYRRDITFAVASGRSHMMLTNLFGELAEEIIFISPPPRLWKIFVRYNCHTMTDEIRISITILTPIKLRIKLFAFLYYYGQYSVIFSQSLSPQHRNLQGGFLAISR